MRFVVAAAASKADGREERSRGRVDLEYLLTLATLHDARREDSQSLIAPSPGLIKPRFSDRDSEKSTFFFLSFFFLIICFIVLWLFYQRST